VPSIANGTIRVRQLAGLRVIEQRALETGRS
jgi:hypothetical protein